MRRARIGRVRVSVILAAMAIFTATSAESCSSSLQSASKDLNQAQNGIDALTVTCHGIATRAGAEQNFAAQAAKDANLSGESLSATTAKALRDERRRCASTSNPSYAPYDDVELDLQGLNSP